MRKLFFVSIISSLLLFSCSSNVQLAEVRQKEISHVMFENDNFNKVLMAAKLQNKPIFMDVYTDWCVWCRKLDVTTYQDPNLIKYLNTNFIPLKMNAEYGEGKSVKLRYNINSYPRLLFLDSSGKVLYKIAGFRDAPKLLDAATMVLKKYKQ